MRDVTGQGISLNYTDSYSDGQNHNNTLAYPTTITDQENFSSSFQYHYDISAVTRTQDPKVAVETVDYDDIGRVEKVMNQTTGGYTRWEYTTVGEVVTFTRVDSSQSEVMSGLYKDGAGRQRGVISHLPGSTGGWRAQLWLYDIMGRTKEQTNPTEVNQAW